MPRRDRRLTFLLALALLLAFLVRAEGLGAQSFWYDEGFSVNLARQGWRQILLGELNLPPLYNLLLGAWVRLAGSGEFAARYLSLFCGMLIVALGGAMGSLLLGRRAGALTALFLAASPIEVWYAQEVRMYAALAALTLASTVFLLRLLAGERKRSLWALYALANIAALYVHYYGALIVAAQAVWVVVASVWRTPPQPLPGAGEGAEGPHPNPSPAPCPSEVRPAPERGGGAPPLPRRNRFCLTRRGGGAGEGLPILRPWLFCQVALGVALAPWLPLFWSQWRAANTTYWPGSLSLRFVVEQTLLGFAGASLSVPPEIARRGALLILALAALGLVAALGGRRSRWAALLLLIYLVVPLGLFYGIVHTRPKFAPRYLLPIVPALLALAAAGVDGLWPHALRRWHDLARLGLAVLLGSALAAGSAYAATNALRDPGLGRDDLRGAAAYLSQVVAPDEAVILLSGHLEPAFDLYYQRGDDYPIPPGYLASLEDIVTLDVVDDLNRAIEGRRGVWLVLWQDDVADPNGVVLTLFDLWTTQVPVAQGFRGLRLRHYVFPQGISLHRELIGQQPLQVTIGQGELQLVACDLPAAPVPSGGTTTVLLYWQALRPTPHDYRVSVRVVDDAGQELAFEDGRLASYMLPTDRWRPGMLVMGRHDLRLPLGLPPGEYDLEASIYVFDSRVSQTVSLGRFRVGRALRQPTPAELGIPLPLKVSFAELELLGYQVSPAEAAPGQTAYVTLAWQVLAVPRQRYRTLLALGGQPWADPLLPASLPTMQPGDVFRVQYPLPVARDAPDGKQWLQVTLEDGAGRAVAPPFALTQFTVRSEGRLFTIPSDIRSPRRVDLDGRITFLGWELASGSIRPGETLHLTLYWQARQAMETGYKVFSHLLDGKEKIWGQVDAVPVQDSRPTSGWLPGEVLVDVYDIPVAPDAPPGQYVIEIGMYDPVTLARLAARDEEGRQLEADRILLDTVMVRPAPPLPARP